MQEPYLKQYHTQKFLCGVKKAVDKCLHKLML